MSAYYLCKTRELAYIYSLIRPAYMREQKEHAEYCESGPARISEPVCVCGPMTAGLLRGQKSSDIIHISKIIHLERRNLKLCLNNCLL